MSILQFIIIIAAYIASVFVFYFIANIICTLVDWDTDYLVILSFVWPIPLVVAGILLIFLGLEDTSDYVADKIKAVMDRYKRKRGSKNSK